jgi:hypothetical protein
LILADALTSYGDQRGDAKSLQKAVAVYREALTKYTQERVPLDWAGTHNTTPVSRLMRWGEWEGNSSELAQAVDAFTLTLATYRASNDKRHVIDIETKIAASQQLRARMEANAGALVTPSARK